MTEFSSLDKEIKKISDKVGLAIGNLESSIPLIEKLDGEEKVEGGFSEQIKGIINMLEDIKNDLDVPTSQVMAMSGFEI